MSRITRICCCVTALAACSCGEDASVRTGKSPALEAYGTDNSGRNIRDRDGQTLTPVDQSGDPKDMTITQEIRRTIAHDKTMSLDAHNVKIITIEGVVTLRGPVKTVDEKLSIAGIAESTPGVRKVDNQLEVARQ